MLVGIHGGIREVDARWDSARELGFMVQTHVAGVVVLDEPPTIAVGSADDLAQDSCSANNMMTIAHRRTVEVAECVHSDKNIFFECL